MMLALVLGAALAFPASEEAVTLTSCLDTYLDAEAPDANYGRDATLVGGPRKAVLVRFPGIGTRLAPGKKVAEARLELRTLSAGPVRLRSVGRLLKPWGEGTGRRILPLGTAKRPEWEATWGSARTGQGNGKWASAGATGTADNDPIPDASIVQVENVVIVTGLEAAVQAALRDPDSDFGLRLEFLSESVFFSSELPEQAPRLVVRQSDDPVSQGVQIGPIMQSGTAYAAKVTNTGSSLESGLTAVWSYRHSVVTRSSLPGPLAPGATADLSVELAVPAVNMHAAEQPLTLTIESGGQVVATSKTYIGAKGIGFTEGQIEDGTAARVVRLLNEEAMPLSRYSFAPAGSLTRFMVVRDEKGPEGSLLEMAALAARSVLPKEKFLLHGEAGSANAFGWLADTRDDAFLPPTRWIPAYQWLVRSETDPVMPERGWLSAAEVHFLDSQLMPEAPAQTTAALRFVGLDGKGIAGATVQVYRLADDGSRTLFSTAQTTSEGIATVSGIPRSSFEVPNFSIDLSRAGAKATVVLPGWRIAVEQARTRGKTPVVEVGAMLSDPGATTGQNLAVHKPVTTSDDKLPAETAAAVDDNRETALTVSPGEWIEIDLGRDRTVAALEIVTRDSAWKSFAAEYFRTGSTSAVPWIREGSGDSRAKIEGSLAVAVYSPSPVTARRIRIVNTGSEAVAVAEIRLFAAGS